jgi:hypothetical protein
MQSQRSSGLVELLKENMVLRAEINALADILKVSDMTGQKPADWRALLRDARETMAYRDTAERYNPLFARLDDTSSRAEIDAVLQEIPLKEPLM